MTDGELVREHVPEMLRGAGRSVEARRLSGGDLARALVNKLSEEADQLTQVVDDREQLISGIAEVTDMLTTLARCQNIDQVEIDAEIHRTLAELGGCDSGTWLVSEIPKIVRCYTSAHVERQPNRWIPERWAGVFAGHEQAHADLGSTSKKPAVLRAVFACPIRTRPRRSFPDDDGVGLPAEGLRVAAHRRRTGPGRGGGEDQCHRGGHP